jgi:Protein of unknown function (DUF1194)
MRLLLALALAAALPGAAAAQQVCRLALSLALDVSSSVDRQEYRLQADGLAAALVDPGVVDAFLAAPGQTVALHIYEWSGRYQQEVVLDWTLIETAADLERVAGLMAGKPRSYEQFPTALGYALGFGATALAEGPACWRRTLDVSGDGENNEGFSPRLAHREFPFEAVTVNGLVIGANRTNLRRYYQAVVIRGPGAFVEVATDYEDFAPAMRRKLIRELGPGPMSGAPAPAGP